MRIAFIRPRIGQTPSPEAMEPLAFASLAAASSDNIEYTLYDEMVETIPSKIEADLVAMTVQTFSAARAYSIADSIRSRGIPVVMGGHHPSILPREALQSADAVVVGAGERVWPTLLADARKGRLRPIYRGGHGFGPNGYDRSLFKGKGYLPLRTVEFHRGCRWSCDFCSVPLFNGSKPISRPVSDVAKEIMQQRARNFLIVDDNLFASESELREFLSIIEPLRIRWACQISLNVAHKEVILDQMAKSGCIVALVGFESLEAQTLHQMRKKVNRSPLSFSETVRRFHDRGIFVYASFVFGYDHDTLDTMKRTLEFAMKNRLFLANFNTLTPMPGTPLYGRLRKEGRLLKEEWWLDPHYAYGEVMFRPQSMTPEELKFGCMEIRREFHSLSSMATRLPRLSWCQKSPFRLGLFLMANLVARRTIDRKMELITKPWNF